MKRLSFLILAAAALLAFQLDDGRILAGVAPRNDPPIVGQPVITDGDSLRIDGRRIRLLHVDACEIGQPATQGGRTFDCGVWARGAVRTLVGDGPVRCEVGGIDQYDRVLAECFRGDGLSINLASVRAGVVFVYDRARAPRRFIQAEDAVKAERVGVWADSVEHPRVWRRGAG